MKWLGQIRRRLAVTAGEARYAARRQFGNAALIQQASRETWGCPAVERFLQDLKYAGRLLRKNPG